MHIETKLRQTSNVPNHQSLRWSQMAFAADKALESFLAAITSAPRFWTICKRFKTQFTPTVIREIVLNLFNKPNDVEEMKIKFKKK